MRRRARLIAADASPGRAQHAGSHERRRRRFVAGPRVIDDRIPVTVVALQADHRGDQTAGRSRQLRAAQVRRRQRIEHVKQAQQGPALAPPPPRTIGALRSLEHEMIEESAGGLQQADVADRLARTFIHQGRLAARGAKCQQKRRVEVQAVDKDTCRRAGEQCGLLYVELLRPIGLLER